MAFYIKCILMSGASMHNATPFSDMQSAMSEACAGLRMGSWKDAWVEDHDGVQRANLEDIKRHCGIRN